MKEIHEDSVSKILNKIYRDILVTQTKKYFITTTYTAEQFSHITTPDIFHSIIGFLPNTKYRGKPFILSVIFNKKLKTYEIIVKNVNIR